METAALARRKSLTIGLPAGVLPLSTLAQVEQLAQAYEGLTLYLTTTQNLRLLNIKEEDLEEVRRELVAAGILVKRPGLFPLPKVCVGNRDCKLGLVDTIALGGRLAAHFAGVAKMKPKVKIAIAACPASCSGPLLADIGVVATKGGYDLYVGGKGGPLPRAGKRVLRGVDEAAMIGAVERLAAFHEKKTTKKQRLFKLLADPEFPFPTGPSTSSK